MSKEDMAIAFMALTAKRSVYDSLWKYYDGDQPLVYAAKRLEEIFANLDARFSENWCEVVIGATHDRIQLTGFRVPGNDVATEALAKEWARLELALESDEAHEAVLVCGEAFVIVWPSDDAAGDGAANALQVYYHDPRLCHIQYDPANPRRKLWAAKWWDDRALRRRRVNLYYPDRVEYWISTKDPLAGDGLGVDLTADNFEPYNEDGATQAEHDYGDVPVFHLRLHRRRIKSELVNVITPQNGINKLLIDMMVAAEYGAFKQRWVISNADTAALKNAPNEVWNIPAGDGAEQPTAVGEFSATDLKNYLDAIQQLAQSVAIITRTPRHYFFGQGDAPSGEALIVMEAPLIKKVNRYIARLASGWRLIAAFILRLQGIEVDATDIEPLFEDPRQLQPVMQSDIRQKSVQAGIPLTTVLRDEGKDQAYLDQLAKDKQAEQLAAQSGLAAALLSRERTFNAGGS